jgi:hypothetical protein
MNQHISIGKTLNPIVKTVGIGDYDQSHPFTSHETHLDRVASIARRESLMFGLTREH